MQRRKQLKVQLFIGVSTHQEFYKQDQGGGGAQMDTGDLWTPSAIILFSHKMFKGSRKACKLPRCWLHVSVSLDKHGLLCWSHQTWEEDSILRWVNVGKNFVLLFIGNVKVQQCMENYQYLKLTIVLHIFLFLLQLFLKSMLW